MPEYQLIKNMKLSQINRKRVFGVESISLECKIDKIKNVFLFRVYENCFFYDVVFASKVGTKQLKTKKLKNSRTTSFFIREILTLHYREKL
jgi:hypothetical protein